MDASARWLNDYLEPPCTAQEQAAILTAHAFPVEQVESVQLEGNAADHRLAVEVTSNRGDCLSHVALAREIAAASGRSLKVRSAVNQPTGQMASALVRVINHEKVRCPLYTARVMRGVTVRPSPAWIQERLRAIGQIPRNNIVDCTNFVLFELGQPTHVFDLAKIRGNEINIRMARNGERFLPIGEGEKEIELTSDDLVIADARDTVAIGGVKGGAHSAVTNHTRDILIESATFDPVAVRRSSRRHAIASASAYRFERGVHPGFVNGAAERLVELILQTAGGELFEGSVADGASVPQQRQVAVRISRCASILGIDLPAARIIDFLSRLGLTPRAAGDVIHCTIPFERIDLEREIDLIEEVARLNGFDGVPVAGKIAISVAPPQPRMQAKGAIADLLAGMGYVETVTHSLISARAAEIFLPAGGQALHVADERARQEPALRPAIVPSLLRVRAQNEDQGVANLAVFEVASGYAEVNGAVRESRRLALVRDAGDQSSGLRALRGTVETIAGALTGDPGAVSVTPLEGIRWLRQGAQATLSLGGRTIGWMGVIDESAGATFGGDRPAMAAELELDALLDAYPPQRDVQPLPAFPAIERDISAVLDESLRWSRVHAVVESLRLDGLESIDFIGTFRGKQIGEGKKSLTMRLRFRSGERTLTHDEVDPQVGAAMRALEGELNATIRK
jgi:phenylalanyl-tRNA synthetase beta chain